MYLLLKIGYNTNLISPIYSSDFNEEIKEAKYFKGEICPRCYENHIIKYGKRYDRQRLKRLIRYFNGVATKYSQNYLTWFRWCEITKKEKDISKIKELFINLVTTENYSTINTIKNRYIELS